MMGAVKALEESGGSFDKAMKCTFRKKDAPKSCLVGQMII